MKIQANHIKLFRSETGTVLFSLVHGGDLTVILLQ